MNTVIITPSKNKLKKFDATINGTKTISFGDKRYEDYTIHKDDVRQRRYIIRHRKMKIGETLQHLELFQDGYSGIRKLYSHQSMI